MTRSSFRFASSSIIVTLASLGACNFSGGGTDMLALREAALTQHASWRVQVSLDGAHDLSVQVPVSVRLAPQPSTHPTPAIEQRHAPERTVERDFHLPPHACLRCTVTAKLVDLASHTVVASDTVDVDSGEDAWLEVHLPEPCQGTIACERHFGVEVDGPPDVIASPDFSAVAAEGDVALSQH